MSLRPIKKGAYTLSVTWQGQHVARSPYEAQARVGAALAASSVAVGRGLHTARATFPARFTFQVPRGGSAFWGVLQEEPPC